MLDIHIATTETELQAIYRLRYQVYVEELGADMEHANHQVRELCEPWDAVGDNIGAWLDGELVGCVRFNNAATTDFSEYENLLRLKTLKRFMPCSLTDFSLSTKLAVVNSHRGLMLTTQLCQAVYAVMRARKAALNYLICQTKLVTFYQKFGFLVCGASFIHLEGGSVTPLVMMVEDQDYLHSIQSPILSLCQQYPNDQKRAMQFREFYVSVAAQQEILPGAIASTVPRAVASRVIA